MSEGAALVRFHDWRAHGLVAVPVSIGLATLVLAVGQVMLLHPAANQRRSMVRLAEDTSAPIGRITSLSAKFTDAPLVEGKYESWLIGWRSLLGARKLQQSRAF